jgi:hypothetical protein
VKILVEKVDKLGNEETAKQLAAKTAKTFLPVVQKKDSKTMLNPVLKYCEVPKPLEQYILYYIWKSNEHTAFQADLLKDLGLDRERVREVIATLQKNGYVTIEKVGNKLKLRYNRGLFNLKGIVENNEGRKIAMKVMVKYISQGYTVTRGKQEGDIRPDLVAFVIDRSTFRPHYDEAIAIEIESPNEIEVHPEQVKRNMQKYIVIKDLFKEVHLWTSEDKLKKLKEIYDSFLADNSIPQEYKQKVKIFALKTREQKQNQEEIRKAKEGIRVTQKLESIAQQEIAAQGAAANNANSKLGSLLKIGQLEFQVLDEVNDKVIVKTGDKDYKISKKDLIDLEGLKDLIVEAKIEYGYLKVKTSLGLIQKISLEPL